MGEILVGTSSWTDKTLIDSGWYPPEAKTAEGRLKHYASVFPLVEVDSTYYGLPSERNAVLWTQRTPVHFTFNIKAFALMTGHPTAVRSLPAHLREAAPDKARVYAKDLPASIVAEVWDMFASALMPLHSAGKLGVVLFQYPEWLVPNNAAKREVERAVARLPDYRVAVEFRNRAWMDPPERAGRTLRWLADMNVPSVAVDMPQGFPSSVPPVTAATASDVAVVRFHGRNTDSWKRKGISVAERFDYSYTQQELAEWAPRLHELAGQTTRVHTLFNNCYADKGVKNAKQMMDMLPSFAEGGV